MYYYKGQNKEKKKLSQLLKKLNKNSSLLREILDDLGIYKHTKFSVRIEFFFYRELKVTLLYKKKDVEIENLDHLPKSVVVDCLSVLQEISDKIYKKKEEISFSDLSEKLDEIPLANFSKLDEKTKSRYIWLFQTIGEDAIPFVEDISKSKNSN